jgi:hypothetical protein
MHRDIHKPGIGVEAQVGVGQLHGFDALVHLVGVVRAAGSRRLGLHDVEHLQHGDTLAVGRQLENAPAAVIGGDRLHPLGRESGQVLGGHGAAQPLRRFQNRRSDFALIVRIAALLGH